MNEQKIFPALIFHLKMVANSNLNWHYTFVISIFCLKNHQTMLSAVVVVDWKL